jgi:hypothetical protein
MYLCEDRSAYSGAGKYVYRSWEIAHRQMNVEIGTGPRNSQERNA